MTRRLAPTFARLRADGVTVVDLHELLCHVDRCDVARNGEALYFDRHHLGMAGARIVAAAVTPYLG